MKLEHEAQMFLTAFNAGMFNDTTPPWVRVYIVYDAVEVAVPEGTLYRGCACVVRVPRTQSAERDSMFMHMNSLDPDMRTETANSSIFYFKDGRNVLGSLGIDPTVRGQQKD